MWSSLAWSHFPPETLPHHPGPGRYLPNSARALVQFPITSSLSSGVDEIPWLQMDIFRVDVSSLLKSLVNPTKFKFNESDVWVFQTYKRIKSTGVRPWLSPLADTLFRYPPAIPFLARLIRDPQLMFRHKILKVVSEMAYPHQFTDYWDLVSSPLSSCFSV